MEAACYHIDAFTTSPFSGNPAAVVLIPTAFVLLNNDSDNATQKTNDSILQAVAAEFNLSETAFVIPHVAGADGSSRGGSSSSSSSSSTGSSRDIDVFRDQDVS
jgi:PhzF family phenazine biosynthesis protein